MRITQTDAVIAAIREKPGITRSELFDLRVNGARIANVTARVSNARKRLEKNGETIVCTEGAPLELNGSRIRRTTYEIVPCDSVPTKSVKEFVPTSEVLEELGFVYDWFLHRHPSGLEFSAYSGYVSWKVVQEPIFYHTDRISVYPKSVRDVKKIISLITP